MRFIDADSVNRSPIRQGVGGQGGSVNVLLSALLPPSRPKVGGGCLQQRVFGKPYLPFVRKTRPAYLLTCVCVCVCVRVRASIWCLLLQTIFFLFSAYEAVTDALLPQTENLASKTYTKATPTQGWTIGSGNGQFNNIITEFLLAIDKMIG